MKDMQALDQASQPAGDQAAGLQKRGPAAKQAAPLRVIAVTSGKGGVGKTSITANLALLAAAQGLRVLIIDADIGLANVEILYGLKPRLHLRHAIQNKVPLSQVIARGPRGVDVLPSGAGNQDQFDLGDEGRQTLLHALEELEDRYDLVLVDSGSGIGDNVLFFVAAAQEALLIVSPEPTSLSDAYAAVKALCQHGARRFRVIVNGVQSDEAARRVFDRLTQVTSRFLTANVRFLGWLPRDESVPRAIIAQRPVVDAFPKSSFSRALGNVADALLREPARAPLNGGVKLLWHRLLRESHDAGGL